MGAFRQRVLFRYSPRETVYLTGSATPFTVIGYTYVILFAEEWREQRQYLIQSQTGEERWMDEKHLASAPTRAPQSIHAATVDIPLQAGEPQ